MSAVRLRSSNPRMAIQTVYSVKSKSVNDERFFVFGFCYVKLFVAL